MLSQFMGFIFWAKAISGRADLVNVVSRNTMVGTEEVEVFMCPGKPVLKNKEVGGVHWISMWNQKNLKGLVPQGGLRVSYITKAFSNALMRETPASLHSVVVFSCRAGLKEGGGHKPGTSCTCQDGCEVMEVRGTLNHQKWGAAITLTEADQRAAEGTCPSGKDRHGY